jgi:hypothetical protein
MLFFNNHNNNNNFSYWLKGSPVTYKSGNCLPGGFFFFSFLSLSTTWLCLGLTGSLSQKICQMWFVFVCIKMFLKWNMALSLKMFMLGLATALSGDIIPQNFAPQPILHKSRRYSQLVASRCCWLACSLLETLFITRGMLCSENLFVNRFVRDERRSWTEVPL